MMSGLDLARAVYAAPALTAHQAEINAARRRARARVAPGNYAQRQIASTLALLNTRARGR